MVFDYDSTIAKIPIPWVKERENFKLFLAENFPELILPFDARVDEMEALALNNYPKEREKIFSFRKKLEAPYLGKHEPVNETISFIKNTVNCRLYVLSNNLHSSVVSGLKQFEILSKFNAIIAIDDVYFPKPNTAALKIFSEKEPNFIKESVFIGDSDNTDGAFCNRVGIPFINIISNRIELNNNTSKKNEVA